MSCSSEGSYSADLKSPQKNLLLKPAGPQTGSHLAQSPIDMLRKNQPVPEAFKLAMEQDLKQEKTEEPKYENVAQVTKKMTECSLGDTEANYPSDPEKIKEIERYERNFQAPCGSAVTGPPECDFNKTDRLQLASDPRKLALMEESNQGVDTTQGVGPDYVNVSHKLKEGQEVSFDDADDIAAENDDQQPGGACVSQSGRDLVDSFDKELDEIKTKALKGKNSSLMGIFDQLDLEKQRIDYTDDDDYTDDYDDYMYPGSDSSTITESINNDLDVFSSADITDEALFASSNDPPYVNVPEKISNTSMEAKLQEHQSKLYHYQEMVEEDTDDMEEMQERSVQMTSQTNNNDKDKGEGHNGHVCNVKGQNELVGAGSLPGCVSESKNQQIINREDETVRSWPSHSVNRQDQQKVESQGYVNQNALIYLKQHCPREACEGECPELV